MDNILLVEDNKVTVTMLSFLLEKEGYHVDIATDGEYALENLKNNAYDLLILDLGLPALRGEELLSILIDNQHLKGHAPKTMVITSNIAEETMEHAFDMNADDYLVKPFSPIEFVARVKRLLKKK
jgi:DNA-binding response OmpR family regulator